ncbi:MAG: hypothetical protein DHS20C18_16180 [Saprospiraceae bacterium]|nr:MAG: hypothetical protein DHS20C18_16180 [Saprospiraceae bacterium]
MTNPVLEALRKILQHTFGVREGELLRALLMQANIFLLISTLLMVKPTANALFLDKIGVEGLPIAFVLVAVFAAFISIVYSRALNKSSLNQIIKKTLLSSVSALIVFAFLLKLNFLEGWVLYFFYIWVSLFAVLSASQFWILANLVFNAREAKRLFSFIGAGAIAGGIFGGYLTTLLAPLIGSENLLFVCAAFLGLCLPINRSIWKRGQLAESAHFKREKRMKIPTRHPFKLIRQSEHLSYLASIIGISVIVAKLVDYQFSAMAAEAIPDPDELAAFFGFWFSNFNVASLLIQLFLTSRLVGVLGVGTALFFLPAGILLGASILFFVPELWAAVFIKLIDGSLKQSINKAGIELIALPIPVEIKNQTKTYIDVFVDSVATGVSGLILIFFVSGLNLSTAAISIIIVLLVALWIYFVVRIRDAYLKSFKNKVELASESPQKTPLSLSIESILDGLSKVLQKGNDKQILYALRKLKEIQDHRLFESARLLLKHPSPDIKAAALQTLYYFKNQTVYEEARQMIHDPSQKVKIAAFEYLIEHKSEDVVELMERFLNDPNEKVSSAALVSLAKETRDNFVLKTRINLEESIGKRIQQLEKIQVDNLKSFQHIGLLKAIGYSDLPLFYPFIRASFSHKNKGIVKQSILAAGNTLNATFISPIINYLEVEKLNGAAKQALIVYGQGIIPELIKYAQDHPDEVKIIKHFPAILEHFPIQPAVDFLFKLLDWEDGSVRLTALVSLNNLKSKATHLNFHPRDIIIRIMEEAQLFQNTLSILYVQTTVQEGKMPPEKVEKQDSARKRLIQLLENRLDRHLERIFRLLGLRYPPADVLYIYQSLHSEQTDIRVSALEFLDNLLETSLKKVLIPIIETAVLDTISAETIRELKVKIPNEEECFGMLLKDADMKVKMAVLDLLAELSDPRFTRLIAFYSQSANKKIRNIAQRILLDQEKKD